MNILIVYYSRTGKTRFIAETLGKELNADVVEIKDLKQRKGFRGLIQCEKDVRANAKTEIEPREYDLNKYEVVIFGTPVWSSSPTPAIKTFIDNCDLKGKKALVFIALSGLGAKSAADSMAGLIKEKNGDWLDCIPVFTLLRSRKNLARQARKITERLK